MGMSLVYSLADLLFQSIGTRWTNARELIRLATIGRRGADRLETLFDGKDSVHRCGLRDAGGRDGKRLQVFHTNSEGRALGIKCHIPKPRLEKIPRGGV